MQRICTILAGFGIGIFSLVGCENSVNSAANHIPLLSDDAGADTCDDSCAPQACDCLKVGDLYRFNTLQLSSVDGNPDFAVIPVLNSLWQSDIDTYELNFIVKITKLTPDTVEVVVTNGARVGDTKKPCLLPETAATLTFPRKGCDLQDSAPGSINVYAGSQQHTKNCGYLANMTPKLGSDHAIPIRGAVLKASVSADCSTIDSGIVLAGSFSKDALFHLCTCQTTPGQNSDVCVAPAPGPKDSSTIPEGDCSLCGTGWQSLGGLLTAFAGEQGLKYGCTSDIGKPSVCLTATFAAKKIDTAVWLPTECSASK
jgi:hypothetical protein